MNTLPSAADIVGMLREARPLPLDRLTVEQGLYGLVDHTGAVKYIGMTATSFRDRVFRKHLSGSESNSHMFSKRYNVGRMWRDKDQPSSEQTDSRFSKQVRNAFIKQYCRAVCVSISAPKTCLAELEKQVIRLAPKSMTAWNSSPGSLGAEPSELVDEFILQTGLTRDQIHALERQRARSLLCG